MNRTCSGKADERNGGHSLIHLHSQLLYKCTLDRVPVSANDILTEHISALPVY